VQGKRKGPQARLRMVGAALLKRETAGLLLWRLWNCSASNRLYSVRGVLCPSSRPLFEEAVGQVWCHSE